MHFECILEHSACILEHSGKFWNILEHTGIFWNIWWNILEHSGTLCYYIECCKKVEFQLVHTHTDGHMDTHTLGLIELRLRS